MTLPGECANATQTVCFELKCCAVPPWLLAPAVRTAVRAVITTAARRPSLP